jgi:hypothetical protein
MDESKDRCENGSAASTHRYRSPLRAGAVVLNAGAVEVGQALTVVRRAVAAADGLTAGRNAIDEARVDARARNVERAAGSSPRVDARQAGRTRSQTPRSARRAAQAWWIGRAGVGARARAGARHARARDVRHAPVRVRFAVASANGWADVGASNGAKVLAGAPLVGRSAVRRFRKDAGEPRCAGGQTATPAPAAIHDGGFVAS